MDDKNLIAVLMLSEKKMIYQLNLILIKNMFSYKYEIQTIITQMWWKLICV